MTFELIEDIPQNPVLKVVGVGGGGGNAINYMIRNKVDGVEFIGANTDAQALANLKADSILQLGSNLTKGLGAGANPELGRQAAMEDRDEIAAMLTGADMVFITAGMGGGTGTGAAPVVAEVAREAGILTVAVVTRPFKLEGNKRAEVAEEGIGSLTRHVDSLITIPNEKLLEVLGEDFSLTKAFDAANDVLLGAVKGIADLIMCPGLINVDFADVRTVMSEMGMAMMGTGSAHGSQRAREAAEAAVRSPLLDDVNLQGAKGILVNITAGEDLTLGEFNAVGDTVNEFASDDARVVVGTAIEPSQDEEMRVTVVATGLSGAREQEHPVKVVDNDEAESEGDYGHLDPPAVTRNKGRERERETAAAPPARAVSNGVDMDYLDVPAFLRRQAD
ncbi:MAG: cell division protein FtsZ [Pseudohongiellaceae bacterium]